MAENSYIQKKYKISAEIVDRYNGLKSVDNIRMIRVISKDHNMLIMEDFMPVIGEVTGRVELVLEDDVVSVDGIHGFYMHKKNQFRLLIESYQE
ncbi:MAG: hypothetical protein IJ335_03200 [Lachnospiraceae bacterium]|nr:hypothetical protein [Lachnospiraceae bacterium]